MVVGSVCVVVLVLFVCLLYLVVVVVVVVVVWGGGGGGVVSRIRMMQAHNQDRRKVELTPSSIITVRVAYHTKWFGADTKQYNHCTCCLPHKVGWAVDGSNLDLMLCCVARKLPQALLC